MIQILKEVIILLIKFKVKVLTKTTIGKKTKLNLKTQIEGYNKIGSNNVISNSYIGYGAYMGDNNILYNTSIGKYCSIASNIKIIVGNHPTKTFVSTHPAFFSTKKQAGFTYVNSQLYNENNVVNEEFYVVIGNDVWIGENVNIISGIKICNGAVIGANSLVTKDCEPYCIYGGVPAKKIGQRFSDSQINYLNSIEWWNKDKSWIIENKDKFRDINEFIEEFKHV